MPSYLGTYALSLRYLRLLQMIQLVMPCLAVSAKFHPSAQIVWPLRCSMYWRWSPPWPLQCHPSRFSMQRSSTVLQLLVPRASTGHKSDTLSHSGYSGSAWLGLWGDLLRQLLASMYGMNFIDKMNRPVVPGAALEMGWEDSTGFERSVRKFLKSRMPWSALTGHDTFQRKTF